MKVLAALFGAAFIVAILWDAFETLVLPRRVSRRLRPTRLFYGVTWRVWKVVARLLRPGGRRETYLSFFGPLSFLFLIATWLACLVVGFGMLQWALGARLHEAGGAPARLATFGTALYLSGTTLFTLGLGDVVPVSRLARAITVIEGGMGFGFFALVIGYLPVLYQAFSRREVAVSLLDARAGSPPSVVELLRRQGENLDELSDLLRDWERWAAELMESHLSYPVLSYFRSQHDNQSWLAALTTILDTSALVIVAIEGPSARQAQLTFAMARHAVVDLSQIVRTRPEAAGADRRPPVRLAELRATLGPAGDALRPGAGADGKLAELRVLYEPYVEALARHLLLDVPAWSPPPSAHDNWRTSAWDTEAHPEA